MSNWLAKIFLLVFTSLLVSCGFHLQGKMPLAMPLHRLYLQTADPYGSLARDLREYLKMSQVELVATPQEANTVLVIVRDDSSQELLTVGGTQQTRQYALRVTVIFEIRGRNGELLVPPQALAEAKTITIQSNQILASSNEATLYNQQMRRAIAYAIMNRIASRDITQMIDNAYAKSTKK